MAHECRDELPRFGYSACYAHLKLAALNGGFGTLTDSEREFVGVEVSYRDDRTSRRRDISDDWTSLLANARQALGMDDPGQARLEFLGG